MAGLNSQPETREELFSELVRQCGDSAYNFAYRLAGNEQDASDLVQEAFLRALENISAYDPSKPFRPWLNRILHNLYIDSVRRYDKSHVVSIDSAPPAEDASWEEILPCRDDNSVDRLLRGEMEKEVQKALSLLEHDFRAAVILADIEGFSYEEMSKIMSCPVGTIRSRIHRGRVMLKNILESYMNEGASSGKKS